MTFALAAAVPSFGALQAAEAVYGIAAAVPGLDSGVHAFGFAADALSGLDPRDVPEPPTAPSGYLALSFRMPSPTAPLPNRWRDELRAPEDFSDRSELWELHLESDQLGSTCRFTVTMPPDLPPSARLRVIGVGEGDGFVVPADGEFTLVILAPDTTIWLEITGDEPILVLDRTWGAVRRLYADR